MTARHPARLGFHHITSTPSVHAQRHVPDWLDPDVTTVADLFKQAGYATAPCGTWHQGDSGGSPRPAACGFDSAAVVSGPAERMQTYLAAIAELDGPAGRLRAELAQFGLTGRAIVVFSSDSGPEEYGIGNASNAAMGSPGPLRDRARSLHEGGIRAPCIAAWPGTIPADRVARLRGSALAWVRSLPPAELRTAAANGADRRQLRDIRGPRTDT